MKRLFLIIALSVCFISPVLAQPIKYTVANAHSHNDYVQKTPFLAAWQNSFGSIEADIILDNGELLVAHDPIPPGQERRTLDAFYLAPLQQCIKNNNGNVYADPSRTLQLMIDIKTDAVATLNKLIEKLKSYPSLISTPSLKIAISGNRPDPSTFTTYPSWIYFDGEFQKSYSKAALEKIEMFSDNFKTYSSWAGKGVLPENDKQLLLAAINKAHALNKKVRLWSAPDNPVAWYTLMSLGVDYVNTDKIEELTGFLSQWPNKVYLSSEKYIPYQPKWKNDGQDKPVKNVIILIGDGTGLAQWYAGYTANGGALNVFNMKSIGLSKTSSYNRFVTDSAPGATSISSGTKTNNGAIGVDHTGAKLTLLPDLLGKRNMKTGIVTCGDFRDATPASFYAHRPRRSDYKGMMEDLVNARVDIIMGSCNMDEYSNLTTELKSKYNVLESVDDVNVSTRLPLIVADSVADLEILQGRGKWLSKAFASATALLSKNKDGFMLMLEGAQIDHGGHENRLPYTVTELMDFDQVIGEAMAFADSNGETLIIVTGDHETGGLSLTGGDYGAGFINGQFSTGGHTAIPLPVYAYGPQSNLFCGVYENTDIFFKILKALKLRK